MTVEDPIEFLHRHKNCVVNQRELGSDAAELRRRAQVRAAPGPGRDPRRRDARPRDDVDRASPRRRPATSCSPRSTPRTRRRRSTASSTRSRPRSSTRCARSSRSRSRGSSPSSCSRRPTAARASAPARCMVPTPAVRNLIREGKTHQIYSALQTGGQHGMQTMDAALVDLVRARQDHAEVRRGPLVHPRGAQAPARRRRAAGARDQHRSAAGLDRRPARDRPATAPERRRLDRPTATATGGGSSRWPPTPSRHSTSPASPRAASSRRTTSSRSPRSCAARA